MKDLTSDQRKKLKAMLKNELTQLARKNDETPEHNGKHNGKKSK